MLHRNDITYSPRIPQPSASANTHHPSAPLAEGKVYSYQLSPAPLFAVFLLRPCFYALQLCLFRLFWYIQIHGDGRQVALHVSNGARLISGKLCGRVQGGSGVRGSRFEGRSAYKQLATTLCKSFSLLLARQRHNLGFLLLFLVACALFGITSVPQRPGHTQDTPPPPPPPFPMQINSNMRSAPAG